MTRVVKSKTPKKARKVIKMTSAVIFTVIALAITLLMTLGSIYVIDRMYANNAGALFLFVFMIVLVFFGIGLVFAFITNMATLALWRAGQPPRTKALKIVCFLNLANLIAYLPLAYLIIRRFQN